MVRGSATIIASTGALGPFVKGLRGDLVIHQQCVSGIYLMLQRPVRWTGGEPPSEAEQDATPDALANAVTQKLIEVSRRQLKDDVLLSWHCAYAKRGVGSAFVRARIISNDV